MFPSNLPHDLYSTLSVGKIVIGWWNRTNEQRAIYQNGTRLTHQHSQYILSHAFDEWREATLNKQTLATQIELASTTHSRNILRRALRALREAASHGAARQQVRYSAVHLHYLSMLRMAMRGWKEFMGHRRERNAIYQTAANLHGKFVAQKCIEVWLVR